MTALTFISKIENGKTTCSAAIAKALRSFEGRVVSIAISLHKNQRSSKQNRFYRGYVIPVVMDLLRSYGNDVDGDDTHDFCKENFLPPAGVKKIRIGNITTVKRSTRKLKTDVWEEYINRIRVFAAENGFIVPMPNEEAYGIV